MAKIKTRQTFILPLSLFMIFPLKLRFPLFSKYPEYWLVGLSLALIIILILLIRNLIKLLRTRRGPFAIGTVISVREIQIGDEANDDFQYLARVKFSWPINNNEHFIEYKDILKMEKGSKVRVWVNVSDPELSKVKMETRSFEIFFQIIGWLSFIAFAILLYVLFNLHYGNN